MMFQVQLNLTFQSAESLRRDQLPALGILEIFSDVEDIQKVETLRCLINKFNSVGDEILTDLFSNLYNEKRVFEFAVIHTSGVPAPYDAWTVSIDGKPVVFFNLSEWTIEELNKQGLPVIVHEVTHALLEPFLIEFKNLGRQSILERIVLDEGMAHFLGFPGDRSTLLNKYPEKWILSEEKLDKAIKILKSNQFTEEEKEDLFLKSNTGPYWEKYGAISGMFRVAKIYSSLGTNGLIKVIKNLHLPKNNS